MRTSSAIQNGFRLRRFGCERGILIVSVPFPPVLLRRTGRKRLFDDILLSDFAFPWVKTHG